MHRIRRIGLAALPPFGLAALLAIAIPAASAISQPKQSALHNAVLAACDARDGVKDGVLENPAAYKGAGDTSMAANFECRNPRTAVCR